MNTFVRWTPGLLMATLLTTTPALAGTFVYVSNADDGNISTYSLEADGTLKPGPRVEAAKVVMPMVVSPDKKFLFAAARSRPFTVFTYGIDAGTGALKQVSTSPLVHTVRHWPVTHC